MYTFFLIGAIYSVRDIYVFKFVGIRKKALNSYFLCVVCIVHKEKICLNFWTTNNICILFFSHIQKNLVNLRKNIRDKLSQSIFKIFWSRVYENHYYEIFFSKKVIKCNEVHWTTIFNALKANDP